MGKHYKYEFKLFSVSGDELYNSVIDKNGQQVSESTPAADNNTAFRSSGVNKAAVAYACMFASKMACVGAAAGVAGAGMVMGPWGAAITGSTAATACETLFTTLVEKYGSKSKACSAEAAAG